MRPTLQAIETAYAGYRFRSRLEARWAVFFDHLGIKWEYEKEGYLTSSGPYLPDFWLPSIGIHVEIKGKRPSNAEFELCEQLRDSEGSPVLIAWGLPHEFESNHRFFVTDLTDSSGGTSEWENCRWAFCDGCECFTLEIPPNRNDRTFFKADFVDEWYPCRCGVLEFSTSVPSQLFLNMAVNAATSARFEHGEKGATNAMV